MPKAHELESKDTYSPGDFWAVLDDNEFAFHLGRYIFSKSIRRKLPLSTVERNIWDLEWLYARICSNGFLDLFYQQYTLSDCARLESFMRELHLYRLAAWFAEAKSIYCRRRKGFAEEECKRFQPLSLSDADGKRFDEIGGLFIGDQSELFDIGWRIRVYANRHRSEVT